MAQGTPEPLGVGIIGTGFGMMHLLGYRKCENVRVVAVCQRTPGRRRPSRDNRACRMRSQIIVK